MFSFFFLFSLSLRLLFFLPLFFSFFFLSLVYYLLRHRRSSSFWIFIVADLHHRSSSSSPSCRPTPLTHLPFIELKRATDPSKLYARSRRQQNDAMIGDSGNSGFMGFGLLGLWVFGCLFFFFFFFFFCWVWL